MEVLPAVICAFFSVNPSHYRSEWKWVKYENPGAKLTKQQGKNIPGLLTFETTEGILKDKRLKKTIIKKRFAKYRTFSTN